GAIERIILCVICGNSGIFTTTIIFLCLRTHNSRGGAQRPTNLRSLKIKWRHSRSASLCDFASLREIGFLVQSAVLAKAQRRRHLIFKDQQLVAVGLESPLISSRRLADQTATN